MTPPTKIHFTVDISGLVSLVSSWIAQHCPDELELITQVRRMLARQRNTILVGTRLGIESQLHRDPQHLQNLYMNWDGTSSKAHMIYTFNDKDTALLFKLSSF